MFPDDESKKSVSVLLDGDEATMHFIDMSDENVRVF